VDSRTDDDSRDAARVRLNQAETSPPIHRFSRIERAVLGLVVTVALALSFLYGLDTDRLPVFDERGLDNPIYEYVHTGKMAYPAYGHPDAMYVHPPTHYYVSAQFVRLGFPLFPATVMPVLLLAVLSAALILTGRFPFSVALSLVLAAFCAVFIWTDLVSVRPELHLGMAWFAGLVALQAARNCDWSPWRLFLGAAGCTYAGMIHYWATPAFLAVFVYAVPLLMERSRLRVTPRLLAIGLGGGLMGGLYLALFVIPHFSEIMAFTSEVQTQGSGWHDALNRHIVAYTSFGTRLFYEHDAAPFPLPAPRWFIDALLTPLFAWRTPAVFVFVPVLALSKDTRLLGIAGAIVPLFLLFYSQGKPTLYNGYYLPEILLYLVACLLIVTTALSVLSKAMKSATSGRAISAAGAVAVAACCFVQVPVTMGHGWHFGARNDALELIRAAAFDVIGPGSKVAITSMPSWYVAGGTTVWEAGSALSHANPDSDVSRQVTGQRGLPDVGELLAPFDAVVSDPEVWWINSSRAAPLNDWYARGLLRLRGFVFRLNNRPTLPYPRAPRRVDDVSSLNFALTELLYRVSPNDVSVKGYVIDDNHVFAFVEAEGGEPAVDDRLWLTVFTCSRRPKLPYQEAAFAFAFPLRTEPNPTDPHLLLVAVRPDAYEHAVGRFGDYCEQRDVFRGRRVEVSVESLKSQLRSRDRYIAITTERNIALAGGFDGPPGVTLAEWSGKKLEEDASEVRYGTTASRLLGRDSRGVLTFKPGTVQDHVALPWVSVARSSERTIEIATRNSSASDGPCTATLQDQQFNTLAHVNCDGAGAHRAFALVNATVEKVRVVFVSPTRESMRLPEVVALVDHAK
jgi:hypothetical protein